MANLVVKDGTGASKYIAQSGAGTDIDPFVRMVEGPLTDTELRAADVAVTLDGESVAIASIAAGDNNIGNVDIASFPTVTMTTATGTAASSGDNTLIAQPGASLRIVVHDLQLQLEAATATTMLIKSGSTTRRRFYAASAGDGLLFMPPSGKEFRLGTNEALVLNLSGANSTGYTVRYTTEAA